MFLEFFENRKKRPFFEFFSIFGVFGFARAMRPLVVRFCSNLHQNFSFFMQFLDMPKNAKIGPKKISGWPPLKAIGGSQGPKKQLWPMP